MYNFHVIYESTKKKKKAKSLDSQSGYDKAERHTKYDPPGTNYGANISARPGFVG